MKVVVFFAVAVLWVVAPVALATILGLRGPPPYVSASPPPGPEWEVGRVLPDGSRVTVTPHPTEADAVAAMTTSLAGIPMSTQSSTLHVRRYTRSDDGRVGLVAPVGRYVVRVEGADRGAVDAALASLPFIVENPRKNLVWLAFTRYASATAAGFGIYILAFLLWLARGAAWAARIDPTGTPPATAEEVRERLLALDALDAPFQVREERPGRLVAEWRIADARWAGPMEAGGLSRVHRVHLDLDASARRARVVDEERKVAWRGGIGTLGGRATFFRGIHFTRYERAAAVGVLFDEGGGWSVRPAYDYRFQLSEMKNPLIDVVTRSGWTWSPVVTFFRPVGG